MSGESDLGTLLRHAAPRLEPGEFVFVSVPNDTIARLFSPRGVFAEPEGITVICTRERALAAGREFDGVFRQITLTVHSSLGAVGFLAAITTALARHGIACNPVSALHHDHLFVPAADAARALEALRDLADQ